MKTGIELIAEERQEQIEKHGRSIERDVKENSDHQLLDGVCGLLEPYDSSGKYFPEQSIACCPKGWDVDLWTKMCNKSYQERLVIAGALIAAELDRLQNS